MGRALVVAILGGLLLLVAAALLLQTPWAHSQLRRLIVSQANNYLTATLEIDRLGGSLFRGIELDGVRLRRGEATLVAIDRVQVSYSIRELVDWGTVIRRLSLTRPRIVAAREPDGRWNLGALVRRGAQRPRTSGPGRPIRIDRIEVVDGTVTLQDRLKFGAANVPASFTGLNAQLSFQYQPVTWTLDFSSASFAGADPQLDVRALSGVVSSGDEGWLLRALHVATPRSEFTLDGRVDRRQTPTVIDLTVGAPRFAFQEWGGVLRGLSNIAVESAIEARLRGPAAAMDTTLDVRSTGGDIVARLTLNSMVPGWHGRGSANVRRLDLARWLNRPERPSDISGEAEFDLDLQLGGHFPRGAFSFRGPHAGYLQYEADDVVARGRITDTHVLIASAAATAYRANVRLLNSAMTIDAPYTYHFAGRASGVDLRYVPTSVPVPHVESSLEFAYDVSGQFAEPFIRGDAIFSDSVFLGAQLGAGTTGFIDTQSEPLLYRGEGPLWRIDLNHFGRELDIAWMQEPRYAGTVAGRFHVDGAGADLATMRLTGGGRLDEASLFSGLLSNADVTVAIADGSLEGTFDGDLLGIDPRIPMQDPTYDARLTGHARARFAVRDLLVRAPELDDYAIDAALDLSDSVVRLVDVTRGSVQASMAGGTMRIANLEISGPGADLEASGTLELDGVRSSSLDYRVRRADLSKLEALLGRRLAGDAVTAGRLTGTTARMRFQGDGSVSRLAASGVEVGATNGSYDVAFPSDIPSAATGSVKAHLSSMRAFGQEWQSIDGAASYDAGTIDATVDGVSTTGLGVSLKGLFLLDQRARRVDINRLSATVARTAWTLVPGVRPRIDWTDTSATVSGFELVDAASGTQRLAANGEWTTDGRGRLLLTARGLSLDALFAGTASAARYGGMLDATATVTGTAEQPAVSSDFTITQGRVRRLGYQRFGGHVEYRNEQFTVDVRLDQAEGVWLTAAGDVPLSLFDRMRSAAAMRLVVKSSPVSLTLLEGVTDVVRNVTGTMQLDVTVLGTSRDPHFAGRAEVDNASFEVAASGARYRNGRFALALSTDRVGVEALHVEDEDGHTLDVTGSLGTHELRVGDLQVTVNARSFQVLRNEFGRVEVDAQLNLAGEFESPRLTGRVTVTGGEVNVDRILDRALFQPYATEAQVAAQTVDIDPIVALNPWERMGMDIELHVPGTLRMLGENVQVSPGTPLGLGNINLRAFGDLYLYKDPAKPMYVNGSFDSLSGTYVFQGRRFDLDPVSSITFRGDLNPELYVAVNRLISGVETRVQIVGQMREPELRLTSVPPLDPSEVLSLIVFNTSTNELSALQQEQLAVRAGTLAAGFLAAPMMSALERTLGIDTLEIEPGADIRGGPRVTVGNEIAPGLVARFSRQFGEADYDEATLEYYLSRILRIRATFSDAGAVSARSPFRRVERAGVDLLLFFSF